MSKFTRVVPVAIVAAAALAFQGGTAEAQAAPVITSPVSNVVASPMPTSSGGNPQAEVANLQAQLENSGVQPSTSVRDGLVAKTYAPPNSPKIVTTQPAQPAPGTAQPQFKVTYGFGIYLGLTGSEITALQAATVAGGVLTCAFASKFPPVGYIITGLCALGGGAALLSTLNGVVTTPGAYDLGQCYQTELLPPDGNFTPVGPENC